MQICATAAAGTGKQATAPAHSDDQLIILLIMCARLIASSPSPANLASTNAAHLWAAGVLVRVSRYGSCFGVFSVGLVGPCCRALHVVSHVESHVLPTPEHAICALGAHDCVLLTHTYTEI